MRRQILRAAAAAKRAKVTSALDLSFNSAERALGGPQRERTRDQQVSSFKRAKTIHKMFSRSTTASEASISLQTQLIHSRQSSAGSVLCSPLLSSSPRLPSGNSQKSLSQASAPAESAGGWERCGSQCNPEALTVGDSSNDETGRSATSARAAACPTKPPAPRGRTSAIGWAENKELDSSSAASSSASSSCRSARSRSIGSAFDTLVQDKQAKQAARLDLVHDKQAARLDKLTDIVEKQAAAVENMVVQQTAAIESMSRELTSLRKQLANGVFERNVLDGSVEA